MGLLFVSNNVCEDQILFSFCLSDYHHIFVTLIVDSGNYVRSWDTAGLHVSPHPRVFFGSNCRRKPSCLRVALTVDLA